MSLLSQRTSGPPYIFHVCKMEVIFAVFAALLFISTEVRAQTCYQCASMTSLSGKIDLPETLPGFASCDSPGQTDCSSAGGGCSHSKFDVTYNEDGYGDEIVRVVQTACGINQNQCVSGPDLDQALNAASGMINAQIPGDTVTFVTATGEVCFCTGDLCNTPAGGSASSWKISLSTLLLSLLISLLSGKL